MANPYDKFLNSENLNQQPADTNPYDQYLNIDERGKSDFKLSNEDPEVDFTQPVKIPEDQNPYDKFLNTGEFGTGTAEDVELSNRVSNAFKLGFADTYRGVTQMATSDEEKLQKLRQQQKELYESFEGPGGYLVAAAYFGGAILDPAGWLIPVTKAKTLYQMAKYGFVTSGLAGALGYVDDESMLDTRFKQAAASALGGTVVSPLIGAGVRKIRGKKTELGLPGLIGTKDKDITIKAAAENNLQKTKLFGEAGNRKRDAVFRDKFDIQDSERLKDLPIDKDKMLGPIRKFYKQFTDSVEKKYTRPFYEKITDDKGIMPGLSGAELGTGAITGVYGYQLGDDDAPISEKLGRMGIGFLAGAAGLKGTKAISKKTAITRKFGKDQEDETEEVSESLYDLLGRWFIDGYGLPKNYKTLLADSQGHSNHIAFRFMNLSNKIRNNLTADESKVLFNMLEGDNIYKVSSESLNKVSKEARDLITEVAQEYVDMGILSPATFEKNKNIYLKRTYSKYKDDTRKFGEELRLRGAYQKVSKQEYEDYFKEQKAFTTTSLIEKPIFELEDVPGPKGKLKYLFDDVQGKKEVLKNHRGWELLNLSKKKYDALNPTDTVEIRWEFTKPQRVGLGEIEDAAFAIAETGRAFSNTLPKLKFYDNLANQNYTYTKIEYDELAQEIKDKVVKMPTTKLDPGNPESGFRYGNLAGKYVPEEIYKDLLSATRFYNTTSKTFFGKWYRKGNSLWKVSKTAWNPTVHTNNIMSNFVLHDLIDADFKYLPRAYKALMQHGKDNKISELVEAAQKHGVFEADFVTKELEQFQKLKIASPYKFEGDAWNSASKASYNIYQDLLKTNPLAKLTDWYRFEDHVFRLSVFQDRLAKGFSAAEAGLDARRSFVDYNINAPAINWMRLTMTPFLAYTYRIVPLLSETAVVRPWKFAKYAALGYGLNSLGDLVGGGNEKAERALMQEKDKGTFIFDFMPFRKIKLPVPQIRDKPFEGPTYVDLTRFVPGGDIFDIGGKALPYLPAPIQPNFGLGGQFVSSLLGYDLFSQKRLRGLGVSDYEDSKIKGRQLFQGLLPNIPFLPGSFATQRIQAARKGEPSPFRVKETELSALFRALGFKFETQSIEKLEALKAGEINRKLKAYNEQATDLQKKYSRGLINENTFEKDLEVIQNKVEKLANKYEEAFAVYKPEEYRQPLKLNLFGK